VAEDPDRRGPEIHHYRVRCAWSGSTGGGYEAYDRTHRASVDPGGPTLTLSADPAFSGDARLLNPEQMVVLAAASCQLLSFLAVAARARVDVRHYEDRGEATMPDGRLTRLESIVLHPTIGVLPPTTAARVEHLVEVAHRECFVANSLRTPVVVHPTVVILDPRAAERPT
jgi:organic hydroperoxide reductase OsmC/OhrA